MDFVRAGYEFECLREVIKIALLCVKRQLEKLGRLGRRQREGKEKERTYVTILLDHEPRDVNLLERVSALRIFKMYAYKKGSEK